MQKKSNSRTFDGTISSDINKIKITDNGFEFQAQFLETTTNKKSVSGAGLNGQVTNSNSTRSVRFLWSSFALLFADFILD